MTSRVQAIESVALQILKSHPPQYRACVRWTAHRGGWSNLRLAPCAGPKDGYQNLELLADWSEVGTAPTVTVPSSFFLGANASGYLGVRIHSQTNAVEASLDASAPAIEGVGDAFPWSAESDAAAQMRLSDVIGRPIRVLAPGDWVPQMVVPGRVTIYVNEAHRATQVAVEADLGGA